MSLNNELTYTERLILVEHILESDKRYLEKLLLKRMQLQAEVQALDIAILKKEAEYHGMQEQLSILRVMQ